MKNIFIKLLILIALIIVSSFYLSGCMMAGMGMMHGDGNGEMENNSMDRIIIKEYNTAEYKITAEFPAMITANSNVCRIKILDKTGNTLLSDAKISLELLNEKTNGDTDHNMKFSHVKFQHTKFENDYFVFSPKINSADSYHLIFSIEQIGTDIFDSPIEIEYTTENHSDIHDHHIYFGFGSVFTSPYFYVSAVTMAVMMFFILR
ncbi:MAG: hypothetical protein KF816_08575 [Melioribacteraceae bacterium]|nr:hypothetical protein [Melioribacteraceae bacterium]